jgi:hypothetical protein
MGALWLARAALPSIPDEQLDIALTLAA